MADGFLGRWSKRKDAVRQGKELPAETPQDVGARVPPPQPSPGGGGSEAKALSRKPEDGGPHLPPPPGEGRGGGGADQPPPPTLEDAHALTPDSDFTRFVKPDVAPEVKNAAFKKLFSDPHFNVMDRMDVYIDDYSKPDPIPPEMLRQLASATFLKLFEEKPEEPAAGEAVAEVPTVREVEDHPAPQSVAQSSTRTGQALPPAEDHADPDLRLQQDDAPGPKGPGEGAG